MNIKRFRQQTVKLCYVFILLCLLTSNSYSVPIANGQTTMSKDILRIGWVAEETRKEQASNDNVKLLQFTSAGHVLGFAPDKVYLVGLDHVLTVSFVNGAGVQPQGTKGSGVSQGAVPLLGQVRYDKIWPGVDLVYSAVGSGIVESIYLLEPGADVNNIRLSYNVPVQVDIDGGLILHFESGIMRESVPMAWQEINGKKIEVKVAFTQIPTADSQFDEIGLSLGVFNPALPLMIDPILTWHTFFGGTSADDGSGITLDGNGNVYVIGYSGSSWGEPLIPHAGSWDAFVAKLNDSGALQWNTFLGDTGSDYGKNIVLDGDGNLYVTGTSNSTWGTPLNAHAGGGDDAFVAKLNGNGDLQWNTFLGGTGYDSGMGIDSDDGGNIYVIGNSVVSWGVPLNTFTWGNDVFIASLNSSGALQWHTFLGGFGFDWGYRSTLDESGNIYVTGHSRDSWGAPLNAHAGEDDAFIAKLNSEGVLQWNTFLGGTGNDWGRDVALDDGGNIYVAGWSGNWGAPLNPHSGSSDIFVAKLNGSGVLQWHTFLGGTGNDMGDSIALDGLGNIYVTGEAGGTWGTPLNAFAGYSDIFIAKLNDSGVRQWHTFLGGTEADWGRGIVLDGSENIYVTGYSDTTWGAPLNAAGNGDSLVLKMNNDTGSPTVTSITRANPSPTSVATVNFTMIFSESVTGVDSSDFNLTTTGITGTSITDISGTGDNYIVTVNTGSGNGTIRLDVVDDDSIQDAANNPLGGVGVGNGDFTTGETYDINKEQILNGGFNTYPVGKKIPTSWKAVNFSTSDGKITTVKQEGTASVRIIGTGVSKTLSQTLLLSGSSGDAFNFSFWVKGKSIPTADYCRAQVLFYNGTVLNPTKKTINCTTGTYAFTQKSLAFTAPGDYTKIVVKFTYSKASGTAWFDAVSLTR